MSARSHVADPARSPEALHAILEDAFRRGDLDAYAAAHEPDATVVMPPDGRPVHGLAEIRAAMAPMLARHPRLTSEVLGAVHGDGLALTHARWHLVLTEADGTPSELRGRGTIVSRRRPDGTWGIVVDDPTTPA